MTQHLYIGKLPNQTLESFVDNLSEQLSCEPFEEHDSSSYAEERYFQCSVLALELRVAVVDMNGFDDFDFWLAIEPEAGELGKGLSLEGLADVIARKLVLLGYRVIRLPDFGSVDGQVIHYARSPGRPGPGLDQVITSIRPSP